MPIVSISVVSNFKKKGLGALLALLGLAVGFGFWRQGVVAKRATVSSSTIQQGIASGDFVSARSALAGIADPALRAAKEHDVRIAELKQAISVRDTGLMRMAIGKDDTTWVDPKLLESADLELAREAVQARDFTTYQELVARWKSKSALAGQWVLLEADQLLARKKPDEALAFLKSAVLTGPEDALRYARIALLEAKEPWKAMESLDQGLKADPRNADILSFRAQIEEAGGRIADARLDYVAAVLSERKNPLHREILANFYLRTGDPAAAAETWRDAAEDTGLGVYGLKSWFWSRVSGVPLSKPLPPSRQAGWKEFNSSLAALPANVFWNAALEIPLASIRGGDQRAEIIWLRLLELIRSGDLKSAESQLDHGFPREAQLLKPELALRLLAHLNVRQGKDARLSFAGRFVSPVSPDEHPFLVEFAKWANRAGTDEESKRFETWFVKPNAAVAMLFASGWSGAAVIVGNAENLAADSDMPDGFDYGYAKSLLARDGKEPARKWLESLPTRSAAADLLLGEIQLTSGALDAGLALLGKVAAGNSPQASRASWTLALVELDRGQPAKAREITLASPALAASTSGKEILARAALAEGSRQETIRIYQELGETSADAMIFLSKEAFAAKDFEQARKWTGALARKFPEEPSFRNNLLKIDEAEKSAKP